MLSYICLLFYDICDLLVHEQQTEISNFDVDEEELTAVLCSIFPVTMTTPWWVNL